jgi:hypothetical protein
MTLRLTWAEVCARRLARHALAAPSDRAIDDVVAAMCGAHAQVMSAAELSVGLRLAGSTRTDVRDALWTHKSLVKTYGPRGTVHLLPARDLPMWTGALSAIPTPPMSLPESARLTPAQTEDVLAAVAAALRGAELTVDELDEAVVGATGAWAADPVVPAFGDWWPRWRQAIHIAARRGALCFGPNRGRRVTYTDPAAWLPGFRPEDGATAAAELARRYLYAYGPATPNEFAQWLASPRGWAVEVFESIGHGIERATIAEADRPRTRTPGAGDTAWIVAGDTATPDNVDSVLLLPYFDAYTVGCHPRRLLFPGVATDRAMNHGGAGNFAVLLVDGTVAGIWHQRASGRRIAIAIEPFDRLTAVRRAAIDDQVARIGAILQSTMELTIGPVTVGPHY